MKKLFFLFALIIALTGCAQAKPAACTKEAKLCPDGTAVGRSGPNCDFAACPGE